MKIGKLYLLLFLWVGSYAACSQTYTVDSVPNDKLINNSYVSNPDHIISDEVVAEINQKLSQLESQTTVQVALVLLNSIGEADIFTFAQELFDRWGIGNAEKDNGLLILLVMDQRTVRFHTGYGLEGVLPDVICKRIQMEHMIPAFKENDYPKGIMAGVDQTILILTDPAYQEELQATNHRLDTGWNMFFPMAIFLICVASLITFIILYSIGWFSNSKKKKNKADQELYPELHISSYTWFLLYGVIPIGLIIVFDIFVADFSEPILVFLMLAYLFFGIMLIAKRLRLSLVSNRLLKNELYYEGVQLFQDRQVFWLVMGILFPVPFLFLFFQYLSRKKFFRNHPRKCKSCSHDLNKLNEYDDDQHLSQPQIFEEGLKSVDYDVWSCSNCQNKEVLRYVNRFSKYSSCPRCKTQAFYTASRRTIESATYDSTGKGEQTDKCKYCNHTKVSYYTIPKKERSSSGSGGSSGGSWGGGSSGGGGSSSSW